MLLFPFPETASSFFVLVFLQCWIKTQPHTCSATELWDIYNVLLMLKKANSFPVVGEKSQHLFCMLDFRMGFFNGLTLNSEENFKKKKETKHDWRNEVETDLTDFFFGHRFLFFSPITTFNYISFKKFSKSLAF